MTANLVVHFERRSYVITPTKDTRPLSGRRRPVEVHQWADGRLEILYDGKSLPYTVVDECPDIVVPGEVVEQKRIAPGPAQKHRLRFTQGHFGVPLSRAVGWARSRLVLR